MFSWIAMLGESDGCLDWIFSAHCFCSLGSNSAPTVLPTTDFRQVSVIILLWGKNFRKWLTNAVVAAFGRDYILLQTLADFAENRPRIRAPISLRPLTFRRLLPEKCAKMISCLAGRADNPWAVCSVWDCYLNPNPACPWRNSYKPHSLTHSLTRVHTHPQCTPTPSDQSHQLL